MIKYKIIFFCLALLLFGCSNLQFVYKSENESNTINNKTKFVVIGSDRDVIISYLQKRLGTAKVEPKFLLSVDSNKTTNALIIDKDSNSIRIAIETLLNNATMRKTIQDAARQWIDATFSGDIITRKYIRLYRDAINQ